jgi:hypothetical protein
MELNTLRRGQQPDRQTAAGDGNFAFRPPARRKWARRTSVALAAVLVAGGLVTLVRWRIDSGDTCMNAGVTTVMKAGPAHQCVGITDGSYKFDPRLAPVENLIAAADKKALASGSYVTVAYMEPMTLGPDPLETFASLLHGLEGAYAALEYVNANSVESRQYPLIRLLLVNDGAAADEWEPAVNDIEADRASQRIVAVAGLGQSLDTTTMAVDALQKAGIPMVGATITADSYSSIDGLVRVSPTNSNEAAAALSFIRPTAAQTVLVENVNGDDSYSTTLAAQFQRYFRRTGQDLGQPEVYDSGYANAVYTNQITQDAANICLPGKNTVLFAGRGSELALLLGYLNSRSCSQRKLTIITGDDASDIADEPKALRALKTGITLYYTGLANPYEWSTGTGSVIGAGRRALANLTSIFDRSFPQQALGDGQAMMAYDALLAATSAIRITQQQTPSATAVKAGLSLLNGTNQVNGTSGLIDFYDNSAPGGSNPFGKTIPIVQIEPDGSTRFVGIAPPG